MVEEGRDRERDYNTTINNNTKTDSRISLDTSRKTSTEHRFAPPPNSILVAFTVAIVPTTTPRSYADSLPPSN
jgi:hypothetical protein